MSWNLILVVVGGLVAGYAIVSVLMKPGADDMRLPPAPGGAPHPNDVPSQTDSPPPRSLPPAASIGSRTTTPATSTDWSLLLDIPRSAGPRDIEAAFKRQRVKAEAVGDMGMVERLRAARDAGLAAVTRR
jgi:hypothetical protein